MRKYFKFFGILLLGYVLAIASGNANRGRPADPMYEEISCQANHRGCVGDYSYGWPFDSFIGYGGDYDIRWPQHILNILFWTLMVWTFFWSVRTVYNFYHRK